MLFDMTTRKPFSDSEQPGRYRRLVEHGPNLSGRDFFMGDIHDHRAVLQKELHRIDFRADRDRLFLAGDFTSKGPIGERLWMLPRKTWAHAVLGNHELWLLRWMLGGDEWSGELFQSAGGMWHYDIPSFPSKLRSIAKHIQASCPAAMIVHTRDGKRIGVTHAAAPAMLDENTLGCPPIDVLLDVLCSDFSQYERQRNERSSDKMEKIGGVDAVVHGHINVDSPEIYGNQAWIDTLERTGRPTILSADQVIEMTTSYSS